MTWFIVALGAPFVWSLVNHCDKIILSRYFKGGGSGGLMVFVGVVSLPLALAIFVLNPYVLNVSAENIYYLVSSGLLYNIGVYLYLRALEYEDASYIVPFWQLIPVFAYIFGVLFLGEYISSDKTLAALVVMFGAMLLSIRFTGGTKFHVNKKTTLIMVLSSIVLALGFVFFKDAENVASNFWTSMFWNQIGMLAFAIVLVCVKHNRNEFLDVLDRNGNGVVALNVFEQLIEIVGVVLNNFAIMLAPAALVILVEYTAQPLFVFIEGIIFTLLFPKFVQEDISKSNLIQKFVAIVVMALGLYLINK